MRASVLRWLNMQRNRVSCGLTSSSKKATFGKNSIISGWARVSACQCTLYHTKLSCRPRRRPWPTSLSSCLMLTRLRALRSHTRSKLRANRVLGKLTSRGAAKSIQTYDTITKCRSINCTVSVREASRCLHIASTSRQQASPTASLMSKLKV